MPKTKKRLALGGSHIVPESCGEFIIHKKLLVSFIKKNEEGDITECITITDNLDGSLVLESLFYGLNDEQSKICKSSCGSSTRIGPLVMERVLSEFRNKRYTYMKLEDEAYKEEVWMVGRSRISIVISGKRFFYLSVSTLLKEGICYYEKMHFFGDEDDDFNKKRIQILCQHTLMDLYNDYDDLPVIPLVFQKYSLCQLYIMIEKGLIKEEYLQILGNLIHNIVWKFIPPYFFYFFDQTRLEGAIQKIRNIKDQYAEMYATLEYEINRS